jgi:hypothetical protein
MYTKSRIELLITLLGMRKVLASNHGLQPFILRLFDAVPPRRKIPGY